MIKSFGTCIAETRKYGNHEFTVLTFELQENSYYVQVAISVENGRVVYFYDSWYAGYESDLDSILYSLTYV